MSGEAKTCVPSWPRAFLAAWWLTASFSLIALDAAPGVAGNSNKPKRVASAGQKLFEHAWEPNADDKSRGDGLGPLYNERSCVACHFQGGIGGAGPNDKNVVLLTVAPQKPPASQEQAAANQEVKPKPTPPNLLHRGFNSAATVVLHRYSTSGPEYQTFIDNLVGLSPNDGLDPLRTVGLRRTVIHHEDEGPGRVIEVEGTILQISERNTPALFGAGLIASIPKAEIEKVARQQASEHAGVHGRFIGRFGWRGQSKNLSQFIRGACAVELGLQVEGHRQAEDPSVAVRNDGQRSAKKFDLTEHECDDMTRFVFDLPAPGRRRAADPAYAASIHRGTQAFESAGCAVCHRPTLGSVRGIYSDLLVHDMGLALIRSDAGAVELFEWQPVGGLLRRRPDFHPRAIRRAAGLEDAAAVGAARFGALSARRPGRNGRAGDSGARRRSGRGTQTL